VLDDGLSRQRQQTRADASTLVSVSDVKIVEQRSPTRMLVEDGVSEPDEPGFVLGDDRPTPRIGTSQAVGPHGQPVRSDVTVEKCVRVGASVVPAPTVGMEGSDPLSIGEPGEAKLHRVHGLRSTVSEVLGAVDRIS
jgi:hypothetical protein